MSNRNRIKNWSITFPQTDVGKEKFANSFPPCNYAFCSQEDHKDNGKHLHLGISLIKGITKSQLLEWCKSKYPNDWKRIHFTATRSVGKWEDYCSKEDPCPYRKQKQLSCNMFATDAPLVPSALVGALECAVQKAAWCPGCYSECMECAPLWRLYEQKMGYV